MRIHVNESVSARKPVPPITYQTHPDKLARALVRIAAEVSPPRRFIAGTDVLALVDRKITELSEQMQSHRDLSSSLDFDT